MNAHNRHPKKPKFTKGTLQNYVHRLKTQTSLRTKFIVLFLFFLLLIILLYSAFKENNTPSPNYPTPKSIANIPVTENYLSIDHPHRTNEKRKVKYVVIHETGNSSSGSDAQAHNSYIHTNTDRTVSWHYTVDETQIFHHLPDNEVAWHAGDGTAKPGGNMNGIGIELCVNKDGNFELTKENGAKLTAYLLNLYDLKVKDVKQHADFTDKNCPENIRNNGQWREFLNQVTGELKIIKANK